MKIDIIWNATLVCPHYCKICCVKAVQPRRGSNGQIELYDEETGTPDSFGLKQGENPFNGAARHLQEKGEELDLAGKLKVLKNLAGYDVRLDLSGGDLLIVDDNLRLLQECAGALGKENVTLTATGLGLGRVAPELVAPHIGELNFTYDRSDSFSNPNRPSTYASANLKRAREYLALGVPTRAECPLSVHNVSLDHLEALYFDLQKSKVKKLLLMRLFNVGRGSGTPQDTPTPQQYRDAIAHLRKLSEHHGDPAIRLQCALRFFDSPTGHRENPCDLLHHSLGLRPDGTLLLSPWALNGLGKPFSDQWVLGNLAHSSLKELLTSEKAKALLPRLDENFGECKIMAFLNSKHADHADRMFDKADPLLRHRQAAASQGPALVGAGTETEGRK